MTNEIAKREPNSIGFQVAKAEGAMSRHCHVCRAGDEVRGFVNRQAANLAPVGEIFQMLNLMDHTVFPKNRVPSQQSIANHIRNHLPIRNRAFIKNIERRNAEIGLDMEEGAENLLNARGVVDNVILAGHLEIMAGKAIPTVKETLEAVKLSEQFKKEDSHVFGAEEALSQLQKILSAIQTICSPQQIDQILAMLSENEDITDAEVIEDAWAEDDDE